MMLKPGDFVGLKWSNTFSMVIAVKVHDLPSLESYVEVLCYPEPKGWINSKWLIRHHAVKR